MFGTSLLGFCSPPWPINELGFLLDAVFLSGLVCAHLGKWTKPNEGVISWCASNLLASTSLY